MKYRFFSTFLLLSLFVIGCQHGNNDKLKPRGNQIKLRFNENCEFVIAQFTDIHWDNASENCDLTRESINYVLDKEKPDLVVLTGDIVTEPPAVDGWKSIAMIFEEAEIPWCVTLGNHDAEIDVSDRQEIFTILVNYPHFVGEAGPPDVEGAGNYVLPIHGHTDDKTHFLVYAIDTHNKPTDDIYGHYDWIKFNQLEWYRSESENFTRLNNNRPLPALAFFHIPLIEYNNIVDKENTVGNQLEGIASSDVNSGMFASFIEMGDVMGVFCGHDHENDYVGMGKKIALGFGRRSGSDSYGTLPTGARLFRIYQNERQFDTWIAAKGEGAHTYYHYPSGISSIDEQKLFFQEATEISQPVNGVSYVYYEGRFERVADIKKSDPKKRGVLTNFSLCPAESEDWMGFEYRAWIKIPKTGIYNFYILSDDGAVLSIDDKVVVDNDGSHSQRRSEGKLFLEEGFHDLSLLYFERYMGEVLEVGYSSRDIAETIIPDSMLFIK